MLALAMIWRLASPASADVVTLHNGVKLEGVARGPSEAGLELEVADGGSILLSAEEIVLVEKRPEAENLRLRARWRRERVETQALERLEREEARIAASRRDAQPAQAKPAPAAAPVVTQVVVYVTAPAPQPLVYWGGTPLFLSAPAALAAPRALPGRHAEGTTACRVSHGTGAYSICHAPYAHTWF